jgi:hypothetical protein
VRRIATFFRRHPDFWLALVAMIVSTLIAVVVLRAWMIDLQIPLYLHGDANLNLGEVQNMLESGSPQVGPRLGAPFGQNSLDYALGGDSLNFALIKTMSLATGNAAGAITLFFLLTFPLIAVTSYVALRGLAISRPVALVVSIVYSIVPYHFEQGVNHVFLAAYFAVPLACYVLFSTISGRPVFGLGKLTRRGRLTGLLGTILAAFLIASTGVYYVAFALLMLVPAAILGWVRSRSRLVLASAALVGVAIVLVFIWDSWPTISYLMHNGANPDVPARGTGESANYPLSPAGLFMPIAGHRFGPFASLADRYDLSFIGGSPNGNSLGLIGSFGLLLLIAVVLGSLVGALTRRRLWRRERTLAALTLVSVGIAIFGGFDFLFAMLVTAQIRAWNRMSIFVAFLALVAVALVLSVSWRYVRRTRWRQLALVGLALVVPLAVFDQTSNRYVPAYDTNQVEWHNHAAFVGQVAASLPAGAALYQLPYRAYPEGGDLAASSDYDPMIPYFYSSDLKISYGGTKGREAGWQSYVYQQPVDRVLPILCRAGFAAIWLDRAAYESGQAQPIEDALSAALGTQPTVGDSDRFAVFDLQPTCAALEAETGTATTATQVDEVMRPVWVRFGRGTFPAIVAQTLTDQHRLHPPGEIALVNDGNDGRQVTVTFTLGDVAPTGSTLDVLWPDGLMQTMSSGQSSSRTIALPTGSSSIQFLTHGGAPPVDHFFITGPTAVDPDLLALTQ